MVAPEPHQLRSNLIIAAAIVLAWGSMSPAGAQPSPVDIHSEVAAALYAASATTAAIEKASDAKIKAEQAAIAALTAQVKAGDLRHRAELAAAEERFVAELAEKDRAYAQAIAVFRGAVSDIASSPSGAAALARFNAGDEAGALSVLDQLRAADDASRQKRADIESAAPGPPHRRPGPGGARPGGKVTNASKVIARYQNVTRL